VPRLFVAVWPPDEVLDALAGLPRPAIPGLRWTDRHQWHVTLRFLGQVDDAAPVAAALGAVGAVAPADAVMGPAVDRFAQRVLHLPVAGLEGMASAVSAATAGMGRTEDRPFRGHLTLARARRRSRLDLRLLTGVPLAARWMTDEVCLVESRLSPSGSRYQVLERFRLG
jgi:2'-5' RNA ligase